MIKILELQLHHQSFQWIFRVNLPKDGLFWSSCCQRDFQFSLAPQLEGINSLVFCLPSCQSYGFSSSHVWMWESDYKESWTLKNWYFWTVLLEKTLESPLDSKETQLLREAHWLKPPPPQPCTIVTICMSCFMTGDPDKEYRTNKPPPTRRVLERSKGDMEYPSTSKNPSCWHPSWLRDVCATRKDSELEWLATGHPETNPITIKPDTESHTSEQFSWVPLPYCSPPGCPFPIKSLALSAHVSPRTIHFQVLDKNPVLGPGRDPPYCNKWRLWWDSSSLRLTSWPLGVLRSQLACQWTRPNGRNWEPFFPGLLLTWTTSQSAPTG